MAIDYALVQVPGVAGVRVFRENQEIGRTDQQGDFVLPSMLPYYANRVSISDLDLPMDRYLSSCEQIVAPAYRSAVVVRFDAKRLQGVHGTLIISSKGTDAVPSFGEIKLNDSRASENRFPRRRNWSDKGLNEPLGCGWSRCERGSGVLRRSMSAESRLREPDGRERTKAVRLLRRDRREEGDSSRS